MSCVLQLCSPGLLQPLLVSLLLLLHALVFHYLVVQPWWTHRVSNTSLLVRKWVLFFPCSPLGFQHSFSADLHCIEKTEIQSTGVNSSKNTTVDWVYYMCHSWGLVLPTSIRQWYLDMQHYLCEIQLSDND